MTLAVDRILLFAQLKMRRFIVYDALNSAFSRLNEIVHFDYIRPLIEYKRDFRRFYIDYYYFDGIRTMKIHRNKEM